MPQCQDLRFVPAEAQSAKRNFCGLLAKNVQPESNHKKTSDKSKLRDTLQNDSPVIFKRSRI